MPIPFTRFDVKYACTITCSLCKCSLQVHEVIFGVLSPTLYLLCECFNLGLKLSNSTYLQTGSNFLWGYEMTGANLFEHTPTFKKMITTNLYISHWDWLEVFSSHASFVYPNVFPSYSNCYIHVEPYLQTDSHVQNFCVNFKWLEQIYLSRPPRQQWNLAPVIARMGI